MVAIEANKHPKREYIIVKKGLQYWYARASRDDPDMYHIMVSVSEKEGREIVNKANVQSDFNVEVDKFYGKR